MSAPLSSRYAATGAAPARRAATISAVLPSSVRALTSAPASTNSRVVSRLSVAGIRAATPPSFFALGSAPRASSSFTSAGPAQ